MKIAIIGGGAAGMMAAATINEMISSANVCLIEKNAVLGRKVMISGGGRCNVTTGLLDVRKVLANYPRGAKFLSSAMSKYPPGGVYEWFEEHGIKLKIEPDLRVFPVSNNGKDVVGVFERIFRENGTRVLLKHSVVEVKKEGGKFILKFKENDTEEKFDALIITTGGQAYRHTGSTGEGYNFAESLGHTITPLAPSLNSFICSEEWPKYLAGVPLKRATVKAKCGKKVYDFTGPILFTHKGITGPAVFALSSLVAFEKYDKTSPLDVFVDSVPDISFMQLEKNLADTLLQNPKKDFLNTLHGLAPRSLATTICELLGVNPRKNNAEVSKKELGRVVEYLKALPLHAVERGAGDEFVTAGGVDLREVDSKNMQSKICPGLYFAGEVLDIDGFTGGFNLQASWATGRLAGESVMGL